MKKGIKFCIFICIISVICTAFSMHEFYVSITSIDYNSSSNKIEITQQFTAHDIEKAILEKTKIDLNISEKNEHPKCDSIIFDYVKSEFSLNNIDLNWVGKEFNLDETLWIYLESDSIAKPKILNIENRLLSEIFELQSNVTHVNFGNKQQTFTFNKLNIKQLFTIE